MMVDDKLYQFCPFCRQNDETFILNWEPPAPGGDEWAQGKCVIWRCNRCSLGFYGFRPGHDFEQDTTKPFDHFLGNHVDESEIFVDDPVTAARRSRFKLIKGGKA